MFYVFGVCFCFVLNRNDKIILGRIILKGESKKIVIWYGFCDRWYKIKCYVYEDWIWFIIS